VRKLFAQICVFAFAAGALLPAMAFDSGKWLAERGDDSDMLRLREAYGECVKKVASPAENVAFPLETYPDGTVKSRLRAGKACMFIDTGFIWGENIRVEQYKADGKTLEGFLTADNCIVDRNSKTGWVQGNAHMDWDGTAIKGRGIYFSFEREFIKIFSQTEIRAKSLKLGSSKELFQ
jgi:hypothetical protein